MAKCRDKHFRSDARAPSDKLAARGANASPPRRSVRAAGDDGKPSHRISDTALVPT